MRVCALIIIVPLAGAGAGSENIVTSNPEMLTTHTYQRRFQPPFSKGYPSLK